MTARPRRTRADYERGLPDHHDPTAGFGGAAPTYSALTFRAVLAAFGLLASIVGGLGLSGQDVGANSGSATTRGYVPTCSPAPAT